jgi:hypothetical protein
MPNSYLSCFAEAAATPLDGRSGLTSAKHDADFSEVWRSCVAALA